MNDQLILKFPTQRAYKKEDFYVSPSNQKAYDLINSWPRWIKRTVNIFGPSGSGKSHLASILKNKTSCLQIESNELNESSHKRIYRQPKKNKTKNYHTLWWSLLLIPIYFFFKK